MPVELPQVEIESTTDTEQQVETPWCVIVFNDEEHSYHYVVVVFCLILQISARKALELAYEIDHCGEAVVASGISREKAEGIASAIAGFGPDPLMIEKNRREGKPLEGLKTLARAM